MSELGDLSIGSLFDVKGKIGASRVTSLRISFNKALVTGGGTGIGKSMAATLAGNGAKVYIAARKESFLKEVRNAQLSSYCTSN